MWSKLSDSDKLYTFLPPSTPLVSSTRKPLIGPFLSSGGGRFQVISIEDESRGMAVTLVGGELGAVEQDY